MDTEPVRITTFTPGQVIRPDPALMRYYFLVSLLTGPAFPFVLLASYFRYITLRYRFDEDEGGGVWMAHGILFKKELNLTYRRIQDIHVTANFIERWFGLAKVAVQTASGSSTPELTVEGVFGAAELRDFLYQHMRGAKGQLPVNGHTTAPADDAPGSADDEALVLLREIRDSLAAIRAEGSR